MGIFSFFSGIADAFYITKPIAVDETHPSYFKVPEILANIQETFSGISLHDTFKRAGLNKHILDGTTEKKVTGFLATAMLMGTPPYSLKEGLLRKATKRSQRVGLYRTIPLNAAKNAVSGEEPDFRVVSEFGESQWIHPGFSKAEYNKLEAYLNSQEFVDQLFEGL